MIGVFNELVARRGGKGYYMRGTSGFISFIPQPEKAPIQQCQSVATQSGGQCPSLFVSENCEAQENQPCNTKGGACNRHELA